VDLDFEEPRERHSAQRDGAEVNVVGRFQDLGGPVAVVKFRPLGVEFLGGVGE
jgi:hypothetical protein